MRRLLVVAALALLGVVSAVTFAAAAEWCGGAYDEKQGTNFGVCSGS